MSKPSFHVEDIICPTCDTKDTVRMVSMTGLAGRSESVIWCANGHITYLDRHDRATQVIDTSDTQHLIKMIDKRK